MIFLTVLTLILSSGLLAWVLKLRARLAVLEAQTQDLSTRLGSAPAVKGDSSGKPMLLTIEILNPVELARKESWFAGAFGALTPALLRRIVYAKTLVIMQEQLLQFDVKADVQLQGDV
ncbi:MAG: hypothetical protein E6Q40_11765 [Cupriavidus sp.]|nr:MAG: hypothetical protein E6Q40_11765 [Cupriavidus sp.]